MHLSTHFKQKKIQVSTMFLKHLQTHGAPGKGKKAPKIKGTFKKTLHKYFCRIYLTEFKIFKTVIL